MLEMPGSADGNAVARDVLRGQVELRVRRVALAARDAQGLAAVPFEVHRCR